MSASPIKLKFRLPFLSIVGFADVSLPPFTLITGLNGSGKTHLLTAIANSHVAVEGIQNHQTEIRYLDWNGLVPRDQGSFAPEILEQERQTLRGMFGVAFDEAKQQLGVVAQQCGLPHELLANPRAIARLDIEEFQRVTHHVDAQAAFAKLQTAVQSSSRHIYNRIKNDNQQFGPLLAEIERSAAMPLVAYDVTEFMGLSAVTWGQVDLFQQSFSRLFVTYRNLLISNNLKRLSKIDGDLTAQPLSKEEFEEKYNIPPWEFLNTTLSNANLDFEVSPPELYSHSHYELLLRKKSTGARILFSGLSSGEKVLMAFANCLYYANDKRQISTFPKLLLLDEVDAPLHPSMSRGLLRAITETLVGQFGISVIATTHSPSTVALAPEDAVHVMQADKPGVHRTTKNRALSLLTQGVPTLAIEFSGRRQVFVESDVDARVYESVYAIAKPILNSERSLSFLSSGMRDKAGDRGSGCAQVRRVVNELEAGGSRSVFGLVDWDMTSNSTSRVRVLAHGRRNGIENCVLDPLILACVVARDVPDRCERIGLKRRGGLSQLKSLSGEQLQEVVSHLQSLVVGTNVEGSGVVSCEYVGGVRLEIRSDYLLMDDHRLEAKVYQALPALEAHRRRAGGLMVHIVDRVLAEVPDFTPIELIQVFSEILAEES